MVQAPFPCRVGARDSSSPIAAIDFLIRDHIARLGPPMFAEVVAFHPGEKGAPGRIDVRPMVHQQDTAGRPFPHGVIVDIPYFRLQAGGSALIIDPQPGDIGFLLVSGRDHSGVVATRKPAPPGSFRQYDLSDAVFIGGFLGSAPTQFIEMTDKGIRIVASGPITITADSMHLSGDLSVDGDITASGISLKKHVHGNVQSGGSKTSKPE